MSEDVEQIRRIAKETAWEVLDEEILGPLVNAFNGFEAIAVQFKHAFSQAMGVVAVKEETFNVLKFETQEGAKIGLYQVAYKANNLSDKWNSAYNILRQNNATIADRYYGEGYVYGYWLYGEGKIYRQKLKAPTQSR
jgi:hypothetical protein